MLDAPKAPKGKPKGRKGRHDKLPMIRLPVPVRRPRIPIRPLVRSKARAAVKAKARAVRGVSGFRKATTSGSMRTADVDKRARRKRPLPGRSNDPFAAQMVRPAGGNKVRVTKRPLPGKSNLAPAVGKVPAALAARKIVSKRPLPGKSNVPFGAAKSFKPRPGIFRREELRQRFQAKREAYRRERVAALSKDWVLHLMADEQKKNR
jgi:hypothetical protein